MFYRSCLALVLGLAAAGAQQTPPDPLAGKEPAIPDTPAGHTFKAWLEAFNSGDRALMDAYDRTYDPSKSVDDEKRFRDMTGGFDVLKVIKSEPLHLEFLAKERRSDTQAIEKLDVRDAEPAAVVTSFALRTIPPGTSLSDLDFKVDAATRARVIDGAILNLNEFYVSREVAKQVTSPSHKCDGFSNHARD